MKEPIHRHTRAYSVYDAKNGLGGGWRLKQGPVCKVLRIKDVAPGRKGGGAVEENHHSKIETNFELKFHCFLSMEGPCEIPTDGGFND